MKFLIFFITIFLCFSFLNSQAQEDDLENHIIILKNGEKLIGKFKSKGWKNYFCLSPDFENCYDASDLYEKTDTVKFSFSAKIINRARRRGTKLTRVVGVNLNIEEYFKRTNNTRSRFVYPNIPDLEYKGKNYDFYTMSFHFNTAQSEYILITRPNSYDILTKILSLRDEKRILKRALRGKISDCSFIKADLDKKLYKNKDYNIYKTLDKCINIKTD